MAITTSGLYTVTFQRMLAEGLNWSLDDDTPGNNDDIKIILVKNTLTPFFDDEFESRYANSIATNEVTGTGYTAGGISVASPYMDTGTSPHRVYMANLGSSNHDWLNSTISSARAAILYNNTSTNKEALALFNFGADFATANGTFRVSMPGEFIQIENV